MNKFAVDSSTHAAIEVLADWEIIQKLLKEGETKNQSQSALEQFDFPKVFLINLQSSS